jgi:hypothetical protein
VLRSSRQDLQELPLLALGSQFQGANNVLIGKQATEAVFLALGELTKPALLSRTETRLLLKNASQREVTITLAADPDIRIEEQTATGWLKKVAIEIKGGTDKSNAYNRAGEAEKSHLSAGKGGFRELWTIIAKRGVNLRKLQASSPTTQSWFDVAQVLARQGPDWDDFRSRIAGVVGIPVL